MATLNAESLPPQLSAVVAGNIDGRANNVRYRQRQFHSLQNTILQHADGLKSAIAQDSGHTTEEVETEVCLALGEIRSHYSSLDFEKSIEAEYHVANGQDNLAQRRGVGIVYIIPSGHTVFFSTIAAVAAALAAGNCIIIEVPQTTSRVTSFLRRFLPQALDSDTFAISETRPGPEFLANTLVINQRSTETLGPTLDLASPNNLRTVGIVDRTADVQAAATDLVRARFAFNGRSPYAPDVVLVNQFCMQPFIELVIKHAAKHLGANGRGSQEKTGHLKQDSVLNDVQSYKSVNTIISGTGWSIAQVSERSSPLLQAKVSERLLLLHPVSSLDDAINLCNLSGTHTATYTFASPAAAKYVSESIDAHTAWINHVPFEMLVGPAIPANFPINPSTRYTRESFEVSRPQVVVKSANTILTMKVLDKEASRLKYIQEVFSPLPAVRQRPGHSIGFFEQGIITGGLLGLTSLITFVSGVGYWMYRLR
ncbi:aldehyde dehydrogenase PutA [Aspergillus avenaceus]|uniref:Aldehyde dehydrogenase PutA n=1 Tax=Aspergillus avenaceus TaxID=36643 RepID=A0A5N6U787_ASPAV|nr:aldehyde dehydrogenase PutA [Aspergillus avenaceus]